MVDETGLQKIGLGFGMITLSVTLVAVFLTALSIP